MKIVLKRRPPSWCSMTVGADIERHVVNLKDCIVCILLVRLAPWFLKLLSSLNSSFGADTGWTPLNLGSTSFLILPVKDRSILSANANIDYENFTRKEKAWHPINLIISFSGIV
jgi:hypothetical protein